MVVPDSLDGFDVSAAVGRMLNQPSLWWQAVGLFVAHFADWEAAWRDSIGDDPRERKLVHALRSAAANVGAHEIAASAGALEDCLLGRLAGATEDVPDALRARLLADFRHAWQVAADALEASMPERMTR
jgi:HPt (histidine-containing phosphotransfer) domain-containing protein